MVNCHASTKGLFVGLIVFSYTILSIILYAALRNKSDDSIHATLPSLVHLHHNHSYHIPASTATISHPTFYADAILEIGNLCVLTLSLCATVWSLIKIRTLKYRRTTTREK